MAGDYSIIKREMWLNPRFRKLSTDAQWLWVYVLTAPRSAAAGCYMLPLGHVTGELRWEIGRVRKGFQELANKPFCLYDEANEVVYVPGWRKHNPISNLNVAKHIARELLCLPDCSLKARAIKQFADGCKFVAAVAEVSHYVFVPQQGALDLGFSNGNETLPKGLPSGPGPGPGPYPDQDIRTTSGAEDAPLRDRLFGVYLDWLASKTGKPRDSHRGLIGKWISKFGDEATIRAMDFAGEKNPIDPVPFITKTLEAGKSKPNGHAQDGGPRSPNALEIELGYKSWRTRNIWPINFGPKPDEPNCIVTPEIRAKVDGELERKQG